MRTYPNNPTKAIYIVLNTIQLLNLYRRRVRRTKANSRAKGARSGGGAFFGHKLGWLYETPVYSSLDVETGVRGALIDRQKRLPFMKYFYHAAEVSCC